MKPCNSCGKCCLHYADGGLVATREEIERWEDEYPHIFAYVRDGNIWHCPDTGEALTRCPWLIGETAPYHCGIYPVRPEDCRSYPTNLTDMVRDECEMLEPGDLKQQARAMIRLVELNQT